MKLTYQITFVLALFVTGCSSAQIQDLLNKTLGSSKGLTQQDAANGLKEALEMGISKGADKLSALDGYYKSELYRILLPEEAEPIVNKLKLVPGFSDFEARAIEKINRAAEDAAKKAKPIFVEAIKGMTFSDAMDILLGTDDAATRYLHGATYDPLYSEFRPVIISSLNETGALDYWTGAVTAYNKLPFVKKMNPKLEDHVTEKALFALFDMVEKEEKAIRTDVSKRTSDLLRRVFAAQD